MPITGDEDFSDSAFQNRDGDHAESDLLLRHVGRGERVASLFVESCDAGRDLLESGQRERATDARTYLKIVDSRNIRTYKSFHATSA